MKHKDILDAIIMHIHGQSDDEIAKYYGIKPNSATLGVFLTEYDMLRHTAKSTNCSECGIIINRNKFCKKHQKTRKVNFDPITGERID